MTFEDVAGAVVICVGLSLAFTTSSAPPLWQVTLGILLAGWVFGPLTVLGHELGHALAIRLLTGRAALIVVGRPPAAGFALGGIKLQLSPLPPRGVMFAGLCVWDSRGVPWRTIAIVSLAGPAADLLQLTGCLGLISVLGGQSAVIRHGFVILACVLALRVIANLRPSCVEGRDGRATLFHRDGHQALLALRRAREKAPAPAGPSAPVVTQSTANSVPPPGHRP